MRKKAWPWVGSTESEMGSMSPSGDLSKDIQGVPHGGYDLLSPSKYLHENTIPDSGGEGMRFLESPTLLDIEDEESEVLRMMVEEMKASLEPNMTLAFTGDAGGKLSLAFEENDVNLVGLCKSSSVASEASYVTNSSPMFYKFPQRLNGFILDLTKDIDSDLKISLNNFSDQLAFDAKGIIISSPSSELEQHLKKAGLSIIRKHSGLFSKYLVLNDISKKLVVARYYNEKDNQSASFLCDTADTMEKKVDGLQVYSRLKDNCGLLFPYKRARDVMFHMGSVSYPIDILFIDADGKIKKISKNIQPGSAEVFSCSNVKTVLEIPGGMCNLLNIKTGGFIYTAGGQDEFISKTAELVGCLGSNRFAIKNSSSSNPAVYHDERKSVIRARNGELPASEQVFKKVASKINNVIVLDADDFLRTLGSINLYEHSSPRKDEKIFRGLHGETFSKKSKGYIKVPLETLFSSKNYNEVNKKYSISVSDISKLDYNSSHKKVLNKLLDSKYNKIVFASRGDLNIHLLEDFIEIVANSLLNKKVSIEAERLAVPSYFGSKRVYAAAESRYGEADLCSVTLVKEAGMPVPTHIKDRARKCLKDLDDSHEMCKALSNNFSKNLEVYKKVEGQQDVIKGSKGKYNQSCKRNARITKRMLLSVKSAIEILNQIRDISTTSEIISSIATAAKVSSSSIEDVFSFIEIIDSADFIEKLEEGTGKATSALEDMILTLDRAKEYINSNILGILVITE